MKELINLINNKSQLIMIGGRPAVGKTTLSLQIIVELAKYSKCLIYSLEMSADQTGKKIINICAEQNIDYATIKNNIVIDDCYNLTIEKLKEDCITNNYKYVLIDYLQLMAKLEFLESIVRELKEVSKELNITIIFNSIELKNYRLESNKLIDRIISVQHKDNK